jgi:hypothetical protein
MGRPEGSFDRVTSFGTASLIQPSYFQYDYREARYCGCHWRGNKSKQVGTIEPQELAMQLLLELVKAGKAQGQWFGSYEPVSGD